MKINTFCKAAMAAVAVSVATTSVQAQNTAHAPGDLVLAFQDTAAQQTLLVSLGNAVANFRDNTTNNTSIININTQLVSAFGASWQNSTTLFAMLGGNWGRNTTGSTALGTAAQGLNDPHRTIYTSNVRQIIGGSYGTPGVAQPTGFAPAFTGSAGTTLAANGIFSVNNRLELQAGSNPTFQEAFATSNLDDQNFGGNSGDVYGSGLSEAGDQGAVGNIATFGPVSNVEFALDLYRIQQRNDITGQYGFGQPNLEGQFFGTVTVNSTGDVGFVAVPEPTTAAMLGLSGLALIARKRRKNS